ncbi:MAG: hypothetical protein QGH15_20875, partial [Kiritimatiellia bacterium]|nr:hypothetical protein [Kiritimatiellia bacterium]
LWGKQNLVPPFHPATVELFHNADGSKAFPWSIVAGTSLPDLSPLPLCQDFALLPASITC